VHAVLMASESTDSLSTTSLYNRFAGKFFGAYNEQDLRMFKRKLQREPFFKKAQILLKTNSVHFYVDDFVKFMSVVWMILLYPRVHQYSFSQRQEITEFIYKEVWSKKKPLIQQQDHLVIYKGISFRGLA
jgi:hypothetical protein